MKISQKQVDEILSKCEAEYFIVQHTLATVCAIQYQGFVLAADFSACSRLEHFDEEVGRQVAYERAIHKAEQKIWEVLGVYSIDPFNLIQKD
jgi:hypothetical protein